MGDKKEAVGIFDSGIGGLTVLHAVGELLPCENIVYLGDTARVPYGTKSPETVIRYSIENSRFLLSKGVKAIVVACNSASATAIETLKKEFAVPIIGVIEAGVEEAISVSQSGSIGVIGTSATINSGKYETLLKERGAKVISASCPLFVPLAEEGWINNSVAIDTAKRYLKPFLNGTVDTLIMGCTHYPLLSATISSVCGDGVVLINSAGAVAKKLKSLLESASLLNDDGNGKRAYFVTDSPKRAEEVGSRFLGEDIAPHLELIEF